MLKFVINRRAQQKKLIDYCLKIRMWQVILQLKKNGESMVEAMILRGL